MFKTIGQLLLLITLSTLSQSLVPFTSLASAAQTSFGISCSSLPIAGNVAELGSQAYGLISQSLKMPCTTLPACKNKKGMASSTCCSPYSNCQDNAADSITLCVMSKFSSSMQPPTTCDLVTIPVGTTISVNLADINTSFQTQASSITGAEIVQVQVADATIAPGKVCLVMPTPYGSQTPIMCKSPMQSTSTATDPIPECANLVPAC